MKYLVIGLGSMGKRRIRNLHALGIRSIGGVDVRADRRKEASDKYGISVFETMDAALRLFNPEVFVISTPPALHMHYAYIAYEQGIHCFIEASVVDADRINDLGKILGGTDIVIVPSCTMRYSQGPKKIKELVKAGVIGDILSLNYQTGQYLPDWHPWEKIEDFYVSQRETGGAREIVPFELTWLSEIFGAPVPLACIKDKLTDMAADIDDIYHCILRCDRKTILNITVDVISRPQALRELRILGSKGQIAWSGANNSVRFLNCEMKDWHEFKFDVGTVETGYINPEGPYIEEMQDFIAAVTARDSSLFPNSLEKDYAILQTLYSLEKLAEA
jgi:predicted dehydrogenase